MKSIYILGITIFSFYSASLYGQNNLGFESWIIDQSIEEPEYWKTSNNPPFISIHKSSDSYSGNFSALVESNGESLEGRAPGVLSATWAGFSSPLRNVQLKIRVDSILNFSNYYASALLCFKGFKDGANIYSDSVRLTAVTNGWINQVIVLSDTSVICDSVQVFFIAESQLTGAGYFGYCRFKVDDISINQPIGIYENSDLNDKIKVYPNPANDVLQIEVPDDLPYSKIELISINGKSITEFDHEKMIFYVEDLPGGIYFVKIKTKKVF